jgi:hypothetical protein
LGVGVIHWIERAELGTGEMCVTVCVAVNRTVIVGKFNTGTERERERERERE